MPAAGRRTPAVKKDFPCIIPALICWQDEDEDEELEAASVTKVEPNALLPLYRYSRQETYRALVCLYIYISLRHHRSSLIVK